MKMSRSLKNIFAFVLTALLFVFASIATFSMHIFGAKAEVLTTSVMYGDGASIRLADDGRNGIRFHVRVNSDKDGSVSFGENEFYTQEEFLSISKGILVIPNDKLANGEELTIEGAKKPYKSGAKAANPSDLVWVLRSEEGIYFYESTAYVYNIPESSYDREFIFRGYYINHEGAYVYTENTEKTIRSVSYVALYAKKDDVLKKDAAEMDDDATTSSETVGYQGSHLENLNGFLPVRMSVAKFVNNEQYLYRVGNQNNVAFTSLFAGNLIDSQLSLTDLDFKSQTIEGTANATYSTDNDEVSFEGTGIVKIEVSEKYSRKAVELMLEVIDAKNITSAENATANNVVLLNDIGASSLTISNGYAFYGNGFKVRFSGDGSYRSAALSYGFITIENGVLDNAQVICNIFPESYLYTSEMKAGSDGRYPYGYSAIVVSGSSTISNSYVYGARNNIYVGEGNVLIENTVNECGSLSNIHIKSNNSYTVTLKNITTIQYITKSNYDASKNILGFGIIVGDNESESNPNIRLEGQLIQYNWVTNDYTSESNVSSSYARTAISNALKVADYQHSMNGENTINMGIVYLNSKQQSITDERIDQSSAPYILSDIRMSNYTGKVYSLYNGGDSSKELPYGVEYGKTYNATANGYIHPTMSYKIENPAITLVNEYNKTKGLWFNQLKLDLDNIAGRSYNVSFDDIKVQKYGVDLSYSIIDADGNNIANGTNITFDDLASYEYTLLVTDNLIYNAQGCLTGERKTIEIPFIITATKTSIEPPKFTNSGSATGIRLVDKKGGDWRPAYQVLTGLTVTYWSSSESKVKTVDLATLYSSGSISSNVWTYTCNDYSLTITGGQVHSDGSKITPVVSNNTLYFVSTNKSFTTSTTSRSMILTYVFTDTNDSTTWNRTETVNYSEVSEYDYSKFKNGTLEEPSSGSSGTCLAEGTLITLANGTKERIENLRKGNKVMAFDHLTGMLTESEVIIVVKTASTFYKNTFVFDDGTKLVTINEHGIFDLDLNKYVNIDQENYAEYLGHNFVSIDEKGNVGTKKLVDVTSVYERGYKYDIVTDTTLNYVAEDTLSVTHVLVDVINTFDFGANLMYDQERMQEDLNTYGLYDYEEWEEYCDISVFMEYNISVMKVGILKGLYTKEYIIGLINTYVLDESVQIIG